MNERSEIRLEVRADGEAMGRIRGFVEEAGARWRVDREDVVRILIAVEELVTNIVKYGYGPTGEAGAATLTLRLEGDRLTTVIVDNSDPFDPFAAPDPDLEAPIEARRVGGLGLYLVKTLMDQTRYRRDGGQNVVEISRRVTLAK